MALMAENLFSENILDEPDELELIQEGDTIGDHEILSGNEVEGNADENKDKSEDKQEEKKKRKLSQKPKLNILKLMDRNGLTAIERLFKSVNFKGKGYEREDLNMILRKMEIWAHQLYPSLQFDDCLAKLEKLGHNKSVTTYVKKIRMGLEDEVFRGDFVEDGDDDDNDNPNELHATSPNHAFDQLIGSQNNKETSQPTGEPSGLTAEQRERMLRNRLIAEQRRMARMKARQLQTNLTNNSDSVSDSVQNNGSILDSVQSDLILDSIQSNSNTLLNSVQGVANEVILESNQNVDTFFDLNPSNITINESNLLMCSEEISRSVSDIRNKTDDQVLDNDIKICSVSFDGKITEHSLQLNENDLTEITEDVN